MVRYFIYFLDYYKKFRALKFARINAIKIYNLVTIIDNGNCVITIFLIFFNYFLEQQKLMEPSNLSSCTIIINLRETQADRRHILPHVARRICPAR